jgi:hypothetical protein
MITSTSAARRAIAALAVSLLALAACGSDDGGGKVESAMGVLTLSDASIVDSIGGQVAEPGFQILVVTFSGEASDDVGSAMRGSEGVYVIGNDGSRTERFMAGTTYIATEKETGKPKLEIGFTPPLSATAFTLHWPDNEPIALELSE